MLLVDFDHELMEKAKLEGEQRARWIISTRCRFIFYKAHVSESNIVYILDYKSSTAATWDPRIDSQLKKGLYLANVQALF